MRQEPLSDEQDVSCLHGRLQEWSKNLVSGAKPSLSPVEVLTGKYFRAELCPMLDYEKPTRALCLQVGLRKRGPGRHRDRYIYLRIGLAHRRLSQPRAWHRALGGLLPTSQARRHRRLSFARLSRNIYWTPLMPPDDLKAQLIIALVQLRVLPLNCKASSWLEIYLKRFRIGSRWGHKPSPSELKTIRQSVVRHLLCHFSRSRGFSQLSAVRSQDNRHRNAPRANPF